MTRSSSNAEQIVKMKREFVEQISQATGGPLKYKGPDMKKVHKGMGITDEQFDAAVADLKKALEKNKVAAEDRKTILDAVENYRKEIVQPKKRGEEARREKGREKIGRQGDRYGPRHLERPTAQRRNGRLHEQRRQSRRHDRRGRHL